jgi:hypothetical protein
MIGKHIDATAWENSQFASVSDVEAVLEHLQQLGLIAYSVTRDCRGGVEDIVYRFTGDIADLNRRA